MELRRKKRYPVKMRAEFSADNTKGVGVVRNLSLEGLYLETDSMMQHNISVQLKLLMQDKSPGRKLSGRIVHSNGNGFGIQLTDIQ